MGEEALAAIERKAKRRNALIVFESGVSLLPSVQATWASQAHKQVLHYPFNWKRVSLAGAIACKADGSDSRLFFELRPGAYNDETSNEFLNELHDDEQLAVLLI